MPDVSTGWEWEVTEMRGLLFLWVLILHDQTLEDSIAGDVAPPFCSQGSMWAGGSS